MKQLTVYDTITRRLESVDPANASSVPLPAFRVQNGVPATGSLLGEAVLDRTTGIPWIWDGAQWSEVALPVIIHEADDNTILAGNYPDGSVIMSEASGNIWTKTPTGLLSLGLRTYVTAASLVADTPPDGTLGFAMDTGEFSVRAGGTWANLAHQGVYVGTTASANPVAGDLWLDITTAASPVLKFHTGTAWVPIKGGIDVSATGPASPQDGDVWWEPAAKRLRVRQGGTWHWGEKQQIGGGIVTNRPNPMDEYSLYQESNDKHALWLKRPGTGPIILNQGEKVLELEAKGRSGTPICNVADFRQIVFELTVIPRSGDTNLFAVFNETAPTSNNYFAKWFWRSNAGGTQDSEATNSFGTTGAFQGLLDCRINNATQVTLHVMNPYSTSMDRTVRWEGVGRGRDNAYHNWAGTMLFGANFGRFTQFRFSCYGGESHDWLAYGYGYR